VTRAAENGGEKTYMTLDELVADYRDGSLRFEKECHDWNCHKHSRTANGSRQGRQGRHAGIQNTQGLIEKEKVADAHCCYSEM
jgi:hypothetical protein